MRFILSVLFLYFASLSYAETKYPLHCTPIQMNGTSLTLSSKKQGLVFIHNKSKFDLWITHPESEPSAKAGWPSRLGKGRWSALALDKKRFELNCVETKPGHEQQVSCERVISACLWSKIEMSKKETGTFWVGENQRLSELLNHIGERGFKIPRS